MGEQLQGGIEHLPSATLRPHLPLHAERAKATRAGPPRSTQVPLLAIYRKRFQRTALPRPGESPKSIRRDARRRCSPSTISYVTTKCPLLDVAIAGRAPLGLIRSGATVRS